jgi:hypothetical protein
MIYSKLKERNEGREGEREEGRERKGKKGRRERKKEGGSQQRKKEGKNFLVKILYPEKLSFRNKEDIKTFQDNRA